MQQAGLGHLADPAQRGGWRHATGDAKAGDRDAGLFGARGGQVEQHIPGRIGKQVAIEEARAHLALADDPPHQLGVGQGRAGGAQQAFLRTTAVVGRFEAEGACGGGGRGGGHSRFRAMQLVDPFGERGDLLRQPQQHQPILLGQFAHPAAGDPRQHLAQRHQPFCPAGFDKNLRGGLIEAGENIVECGDRGGDHQRGPGVCRAQVEPGERGKRCGVDRRAIDQHHFAQRARLCIVERVDPGSLGNAEAGRFGILAQLAAQVRAIGVDRQRQLQPGGIIGGAVGEIAGQGGKLDLCHMLDSTFMGIRIYA